MGAETARRRRRTPEEAEGEILDAAEAFLREHPFRDLTIDEVMDGTGLSRPSFYVYFRDRHHFCLVGSEMCIRDSDWADKPIEEVVANLDQVPEDKRGPVRNNGGGHYNLSLIHI